MKLLRAEPTPPPQDWHGGRVGGDVLLLQRGAPSHRYVAFAAQFGGPISLLDIVRWVISMKVAGELRVCTGTVERTIYIANGLCLSASSNQTQDRIGDVLVARGELSAEDRDEVLRSSDDLFGRELIRRGLVSAETIHKTVALQSRQIAIAALATAAGRCAFVTPLEIDMVPAFLHMDMDELMSEAKAQSTSPVGPSTPQALRVRVEFESSADASKAAPSKDDVDA